MIATETLIVLSVILFCMTMLTAITFAMALKAIDSKVTTMKSSNNGCQHVVRWSKCKIKRHKDIYKVQIEAARFWLVFFVCKVWIDVEQDCRKRLFLTKERAQQWIDDIKHNC